MKQNEIEIGKVYACKVSGEIQPVKIIGSHSRMHYGYRCAGQQRRAYLSGINQNTGRHVETTAAKCRREVVLVNGDWIYV
jgi:hypothetical protein